jgi:hypothetical protein
LLVGYTYIEKSLTIKKIDDLSTQNFNCQRQLTEKTYRRKLICLLCLTVTIAAGYLYCTMDTCLAAQEQYKYTV